MARAKNAHAQQQAAESVKELAGLSRQLREAALRMSLRDLF